MNVISMVCVWYVYVYVVCVYYEGMCVLMRVYAWYMYVYVYVVCEYMCTCV